MWNKIFFLYSIAILVISASILTKLKDADDNVKNIKYLNVILMASSLSLIALSVGIMLGQSSYVCAAKNAKIGDYSIYSALALLVFSLFIEGLLIAIVSSPEFKNLPNAFTGKDSSGKALTNYGAEVKDLFTASLIVNSVGLVGGIAFVVYPNLRK